jgi:Fungal specific transcription factor domain
MGKATNMQSSLYYKVKNLIVLLETKADPSLDLVHCRALVTFYEMGHGLHRAAYISLAACARAARVIGLHRKRWRNLNADSDRLVLEEEKRTWWAIVLMDRFINLCNGDAFFVTDDPARTDPLPIEDLLWSESFRRADLEGLIEAAPLLDTPFNITVGQLARECQISHLAGYVVRHVFEPVPDPHFNAEEALQLERTLKAYLPLLSNEELKIGKYCGAYGMCNRCVTLAPTLQE